MSRSRSKRWFLAAASCSALNIIIFLLTIRSGVTYVGTRVFVLFGQGALVMGVPPYPNPRGWFFNETNFNHIFWLPFIETNIPPIAIGMPLWIPFAVTVAIAFASWRSLRALPPGHCRKCDYDLTGNVSGMCPECGEKVQRR